MSDQITVFNNLTETWGTKVYSHTKHETVMKRALKLSSQYPFDVFCVEPVRSWLITESDKKRHFASRIWISAGSVVPERPVEMPLKVTRYQMSGDYDEGYPQWRRRGEYKSLYAEIFHAKHHNEMYLIKVQYPGGKVDVHYYNGKKPTTVQEIRKWKAARRAHIDNVNASWYPQDFEYWTMPQFKLEQWRDQRGYTANDFWQRQRDIIHDIDIHVAHAKMSDKDRIDLMMYRKVLQTFLDRLTK